jgi:hypothetical protein
VNDVVGSVAGVRVRILRLLIVLGEIGHTGALPERVALRDKHAEQHDRVLSAAGLRARPGVMAVVPALRARARHPSRTYVSRKKTIYETKAKRIIIAALSPCKKREKSRKLKVCVEYWKSVVRAAWVVYRK